MYMYMYMCDVCDVQSSRRCQGVRGEFQRREPHLSSSHPSQGGRGEGEGEGGRRQGNTDPALSQR